MSESFMLYNSNKAIIDTEFILRQLVSFPIVSTILTDFLYDYGLTDDSSLFPNLSDPSTNEDIKTCHSCTTVNEALKVIYSIEGKKSFEFNNVESFMNHVYIPRATDGIFYPSVPISCDVKLEFSC